MCGGNCFQAEEELDCVISICMLPCVSSLVHRSPASTSAVALTVASTVASTVTATVTPTNPQKPAMRASLIIDHYRSSDRFSVGRNFPTDNAAFHPLKQAPMSCGSWEMIAVSASVVAKTRQSCGSGCHAH